MNKTILMIIMIITIPSVLAVYGGETWIYHFDECDKLEVNITGNLIIDKGEYTIHNECNETEENYFICNCSDNFDLNVSFKINAINNYTFSFNYDYTKEVADEPTPSSSSRSRSNSGGTKYNCNFERNIYNTYCEDTFCPKYLDANNCLKTPAINHLCCIAYFKKDKEIVVPDKPIVVPDVTVDIIDESKTIIIPTEEKEKSNMLWSLLIFLILLITILLIGLISYFILEKKKKENRE